MCIRDRANAAQRVRTTQSNELQYDRHPKQGSHTHGVYVTDKEKDTDANVDMAAAWWETTSPATNKPPARASCVCVYTYACVCAQPQTNDNNEQLARVGAVRWEKQKKQKNSV